MSGSHVTPVIHGGISTCKVELPLTTSNPFAFNVLGVVMNDQAAFAISCGHTSLFGGLERVRSHENRRHKRVPRTLGIAVQPLDSEENVVLPEFFAITRDIGSSGLSFLSDHLSRFNFACISVADQEGREVVCRVCFSNLIVKNQVEDVYLTGVEFLYERYAR